MATLADLVQELEAEAPLDARGEFSLDADKAREKMQRFQLAVPANYVLLVVQAAILRGATAVHVETDSDDVILRFDGAPFTEEELADVYASIFADRSDPRVRSRQYLAIALNAAVAMIPSFIRLRTPQAALELRPGRPDRLKAGEGGDLRSELHVRDRLGIDRLAEFVRGLRGTTVEARILRERCVHALVPITINGEPINGAEPTAGLLHPHVVPLLGGKGYVGFTGEVERTAKRAEVHLITAGVWIATHRFDAPDGVIAFAYSDALNKDVSHTDVVRDAVYADVAVALAAARDRVVAAMVSEIERGETPPWVLLAVRHWMMTSKTTANLPELLELRPSLEAITRLPLWRTVGGELRSSADLLADASWHFVPAKGLAREAERIPSLTDILVLSGDEEDYIRDGLGRELIDATEHIARQIAREGAIARWRARPHGGSLGAGHYLDREVFDAGAGVTGEVGVGLGSVLRSVLLVVVNDAVLEEIDLPGPMPGISAVLRGPLAPTELCDGASRDDAFGAAILHLLAAIERLVARVVVGAGSRLTQTLLDLVLAYVGQVLVDEFAVSYLVAVGFGHKAATDLVRARAEIAVLPAWSLHPGAAERAHPLAHLEVFRVIGRRESSLYELSKSQTRYYLDAATEVAAEDEVLILDPLRKRWIEATLGRSALKDYRPVLARNQRLRAHMRKVTEGLDLHGVVLTIRHSRDTSEIAWGLTRHRAADETKKTSATVRVLMHSRHVATVDLEVLVRGLTAVVNDDKANPRQGYDGLAWVSNQRLRRALDEGLVRLVAAAIAEVAGPQDSRRRATLRALLLDVAAAVYGAPQVLAIHRRMIEESGATQGAVELAALIELSANYSGALLLKTLDFTLKQPGHVTASAIEARLGEAARRPSDAIRREVALRVALFELIPLIFEAPLFDTVGGDPVSIAQILGERERVGAVRWVQSSARACGYTGEEGPVIIVEGDVLEPLRRIIGASDLHDADRWLAERQALRAFEERPQLETLRLAAHERVVSLELTGGKFRGEIGLRRALPGEPATAVVRVSMARRPITSITIDDVGLPMIAVVDAAELDVDASFTHLEKRSYKSVQGLCRGAVDRLSKALVDGFHGIAVADRPLAVRWLIEILTRKCGESTPARRQLLGDRLLGRIARLPLFVTAAGDPRSLAELFDAEPGRSTLRYTRTPLAGAPDAVVLDPASERLLFRFFPSRVDMAEELALVAEGERRWAAAPSLPEGPPADAILSRSIDRDALDGALWIAPSGDPQAPLAASVALGSRGKVVEVVDLCAPLLVGGVLHGSGLAVDGAFTRATLPGNQRRRIRRWGVNLWRGVAGEFRRGLGELSATERPAELLQRLGALRDALWIQLLALREAGADVPEVVASLREDLLDLPLLPLANKRLISLREALREQPPELISLGLWEPPLPPPEPDPARIDAVDMGDTDDAGDAELRSVVGGSGAGPEDHVPEDMPVGDGVVFDFGPGDPSAPPHTVEIPPGHAPAAESAPTPSPEPEPAPEPEPPTREILLLLAVLAELRLIRGRNPGLLRESHLISITVSAAAGRRIVESHRSANFIDVRHPLVQLAVERGAEEPVLISFIASAVYTHLNARLHEIEDAHEEEFHRNHCELMASALTLT